MVQVSSLKSVARSPHHHHKQKQHRKSGGGFTHPHPPPHAAAKNGRPLPVPVPGKSLKRRASWVDVSDEESTTTPTSSAKGKASTMKETKENGAARSGSKEGRLAKKKMKRGSSALSQGRVQPVLSIQEQRKQLPIFRGKEAIVEEIRRNDVTILVGETGSGKTTQVPQFLLEAGLAANGMIAVTQPRKVAATSLAARVALEQNVRLGERVGYSVRFDEVSSPSTKIKYVTDGMLIRELLSDPLLSRYSVVIIDEAHERTLRTDLLLTNLKTIQKERNRPSTRKGKEPASRQNPLKILIMSATLDADKFSKFYDGAKVLYVQGRQHPVTIYHTATSQPDYVDSALRTFFQIHIDQPPGDVLIFLPGQEDIENLEKSIKVFADRLPKDCQGVVVYPMYAALPTSQQSSVFAPVPKGMRKCILATNIAETSITIPGIKYVIDTGKCKEKRYISRDTGSGFDTLLTRDITQSSASQRAGRAGREGHGFCFRLYTEESFRAMPLSAEPEIRRCTLTSSILQLKCLGQDLETLDFMDRPDPESIASALATLYLLGALDDTKSLTTLGRQMAVLPLEPPLARSLLASFELGCAKEVMDIISVLSTSSKLFHDTTDNRDAATEARRKFRHPSGDHLTIMNILRSYEEMAASISPSVSSTTTTISTSSQSQGKGKGRSERRNWCREQRVNERCLLEALEIRAQLRGACERMKLDWNVSCGEAEQPVLRSLVHGLVQQAAFLQADGSYKQIMGPSIVKIHPSSSLCDKKLPAIVYDELIYTSQIYARGVSSIPRSFIAELTVMNHRRTR